VPPLAVALVVLEANERQRADVHLLAAAVRLEDGQDRVEIGGLRRLEEVAVFVALTGDLRGVTPQLDV
jgi:hypothetical protein